MLGKKQLLGFIGVFAMAGSLLARPAQAQDWTVIPPPDSEIQGNFDDALAPYGEWTDVDGTRAWRPSASVVGEDFQPYATNGQWVSSDYGWYFQSDYPWGWAPFHYGRWALDANYGWIWIPGTVWAPAWVDWRIGGGYIGWAPLAPVGWSVAVQTWRPYWVFVPAAHFAGNFWAHRLPFESIHEAYDATAPVHQAVAFGGARWYAGPPVAQVERVSAQPIQRVAGGFTPPAPGRIQSLQLQPPRGYSGHAGALRPAAGHPGGQRPFQPPPPMPPPARGPSGPPPAGHSGPHGSYLPERPGSPGLAAAHPAPPNDSRPGFGRASGVANWSGARPFGPVAPRAVSSFSAPHVFSAMSYRGYAGSSRGVSGGHGGRR
jgi:hypothetical protein